MRRRERSRRGAEQAPAGRRTCARRNVRKRMDGLYAAHHDRGHVGPRSRGTAVTGDRGHASRPRSRGTCLPACPISDVGVDSDQRERERARERDASSSSSAAAARRADSSAWHETIHRVAGFGGPSQVYTGGPGPGFYRPFLTRDPGTRVAPSQHNIQVWFGPSCHAATVTVSIMCMATGPGTRDSDRHTPGRWQTRTSWGFKFKFTEVHGGVY
jgi:hypothetical protein